MLNYPNRSPLQTILNDADGKPRVQATPAAEQNGQAALSPSKTKAAAAQTSARSAGVPANPNKPEDKESPEYKKKQAMLAGPILSLDYDNSTTYGMEPSLFTCLKDMFEAIIAHASRTGVVSPKLFLKMLQDQNEMFRGAMHQDAHEFLNLLLNAVVENVEEHAKKIEMANGSADVHTLNGSGALSGVPRPNVTELNSMSSKVHGLFEGTLTSETKCLTCENISQRDEPFLDLSVDLENHCSVTSCLRKFSEEEMLCERDKFFCDKCGGLQEAEKRMKIKRLPRILALHLKRFKYTEDFMRLQKLFHRVVYPYHLRLFNTTDDAEDPDRLYELYAVVVHIGSGPYHGHYVSIIKTPDRGWLLFDDEMVEPVDKSFVRNFFGAQIGMACAYVLFYQETTLEAVKKEQEAEGLAAAAAAAAADTTVNANGKDPHGLGLTLKTNGAAQSGASPISPADEDALQWASLAHASTAPASAGGATPLTATNTPTFPTPIPPSHIPLTPNAAPPLVAASSVPSTSKHLDSATKKATAKEEKDRKAAIKAAEKADKEEKKAAEKEQKARRKSLEQRNRESAKAQAKEIQKSLTQRRRTYGDPPPEPGTLESAQANGSIQPVAGAAPAAVKAATSIPTANITIATPKSESSGPQTASLSSSAGVTALPQQTHPTAHNHSSSFSGPANPLNRFRTSSKSVSMRKGKFWPAGLGRDSKDMTRDSRDTSRAEDVAVYDAEDGEGEGGEATERLIVKGEGKENKSLGLGSSTGTIKRRGFSLRKKASSLLS